MPKGVSKRLTERELAAKVGISPALVNRKRQQGKSDEQIAEEAAKKAPTKPVARSVPDETYAEAQARKETALADLRELEREEKRGNLISASDVKTAWAAHIAAVKNKLMQMPDELSDKLAAEASPVKCRQLVLEKVRGALTELTDE